MKFYYKCKPRILPYYLVQLPFIIQDNIHDHSTRAHNQLHRNNPLHEHARYSITYQILKVKNNAPIEILTIIHTHTHTHTHIHTHTHTHTLSSRIQQIYQTYNYTILLRNMYHRTLLHLFSTLNRFPTLPNSNRDKEFNINTYALRKSHSATWCWGRVLSIYIQALPTQPFYGYIMYLFN